MRRIAILLLAMGLLLGCGRAGPPVRRAPAVQPTPGASSETAPSPGAAEDDSDEEDQEKTP